MRERLLRRLSEEPVALLLAVAVALLITVTLAEAYRVEIAVLSAFVLGVVAWFVHEQVVPLIKITEPVEEPVAEPYYGEDQDVPLEPIEQE